MRGRRLVNGEVGVEFPRLQVKPYQLGSIPTGSCRNQAVPTFIRLVRTAWSLMRARAALRSVVAGLGWSGCAGSRGWDGAASAAVRMKRLMGLPVRAWMNLVKASAANMMVSWASTDSR
jgi:hypothetical protein